jgi:hypothetical protein
MAFGGMFLPLVMAGATAVQYYGQMQQAKASESQAKAYEAQGAAAAAQGRAEQEILNYNAAIKDREAAAELEKAKEEARRFELEGKAFVGTQKVTISRGGVLSSTGTPSLLIAETEQNLKADKMNIIKEGYLSESYRKSEAEGLRYEGRAAAARGLNAQTGASYSAQGARYSAQGSKYSAVGSLLTGIGSTAYSYKQMNR